MENRMAEPNITPPDELTQGGFSIKHPEPTTPRIDNQAPLCSQSIWGRSLQGQAVAWEHLFPASSAMQEERPSCKHHARLVLETFVMCLRPWLMIISPTDKTLLVQNPINSERVARLARVAAMHHGTILDHGTPNLNDLLRGMAEIEEASNAEGAQPPLAIDYLRHLTTWDEYELRLASWVIELSVLDYTPNMMLQEFRDTTLGPVFLKQVGHLIADQELALVNGQGKASGYSQKYPLGEFCFIGAGRLFQEEVAFRLGLISLQERLLASRGAHPIERLLTPVNAVVLQHEATSPQGEPNA